MSNVSSNFAVPSSKRNASLVPAPKSATGGFKRITINALKRGDVVKTRRGGNVAEMKSALGWLDRHAARLAKLPATEAGGDLIRKIRAGKVKG